MDDPKIPASITVPREILIVVENNAGDVQCQFRRELQEGIGSSGIQAGNGSLDDFQATKRMVHEIHNLLELLCKYCLVHVKCLISSRQLNHDTSARRDGTTESQDATSRNRECGSPAQARPTSTDEIQRRGRFQSAAPSPPAAVEGRKQVPLKAVAERPPPFPGDDTSTDSLETDVTNDFPVYFRGTNEWPYGTSIGSRKMGSMDDFPVYFRGTNEWPYGYSRPY